MPGTGEFTWFAFVYVPLKFTHSHVCLLRCVLCDLARSLLDSCNHHPSRGQRAALTPPPCSSDLPLLHQTLTPPLAPGHRALLPIPVVLPSLECHVSGGSTGGALRLASFPWHNAPEVPSAAAFIRSVFSSLLNPVPLSEGMYRSWFVRFVSA